MPIIHTFTYSQARANDPKHPSIDLDVHLPTSSSSASNAGLKTVIWIHGGGLLQGDKGGLAPHWKNCVEKEGIALISVNYRHCPQVGALDVIADVGKALNWIVEELPEKLAEKVGREGPSIDVNRLVLTGSSAGGWLALLLALAVCPDIDNVKDEVRNKLIGCATIYPITDIGSDFFKNPKKPMMEPRWPEEVFQSFANPLAPAQSFTPGDFFTEPRFSFYLWAQKNGQIQNLLFSKEQQDQGWMKKTSLLNYASAASAEKKRELPIYITHGDADQAVEVAQSRDLVELLSKNHPEVAVTYEEVKGKNHIWDMFDEEETMEGFWSWIRGKLNA